MASRDEVTSPAASSNGSPAVSDLDIALTQASLSEDRSPFDHAAAMLVDMANAGGGLAAPRRVCNLQESFLTDSLWALCSHVPDSSSFPTPGGDEEFVMLPVVIPHLIMTEQYRVIPDTMKMQIASFEAHHPAARTVLSSQKLRQLALSIVTVRAGVMWLLNAQPKVRCELTDSLMYYQNGMVVANRSGRRVTAAEYRYLSCRMTIAGMTSMEWHAHKKLLLVTPRILMIAATAAARQVSVSALFIEIAALRSSVRQDLGYWPYRTLGLDNDEIWEALFLAAVVGHSREYLRECLMLPHFRPAVLFATSESEVKRAEASAAFDRAVAVVIEARSSVPREAMVPRPDDADEPASLGSEAVIGAPAVYTVPQVLPQIANSAHFMNLPNQPSSVLGIEAPGDGASDIV